MSEPTSRAPRRADALSRTKIVTATIELLDASGESALTVRALTAKLATGRGAIYHHISAKDELLAAAAEQLLNAVLADLPTGDDPTEGLRSLALGIFDAVRAHPWLGAQLGREPLQPAVFTLWTTVGRRLADFGLAGRARSDAGSALVTYVLGSAAQAGAVAHHRTDASQRSEYLDQVATSWAAGDPDPGVEEAAAQLRDHDDREQFLAGVNIFLRGISRVG